jgi:ribosomal protein L15
MGFEGGQLSLIKRLPLLRGKDRNKARAAKAFPVAAHKLNSLPPGLEVTLASLAKYHMIDPAVGRVKILGGKPVTVKLTIAVPVSKSARTAIEKAGGTVSSHE